MAIWCTAFTMHRFSNFFGEGGRNIIFFEHLDKKYLTFILLNTQFQIRNLTYNKVEIRKKFQSCVATMRNLLKNYFSFLKQNKCFTIKKKKKNNKKLTFYPINLFYF